MGLFDETATLKAGQDPGNTSTSGIGSLINISDLYNQALAESNNNKLENFDSFVVRNPDLVDPSIDVSGLKTTTDVSPYLLGNIPDYGGIQYEAYNPNRLSDLMRLYSGGFPMLDTPQAAAPVTTTPDTGDGGGMDQATGGLNLGDTTITGGTNLNDYEDIGDTTMPSNLTSNMVGNIDMTPVDMYTSATGNVAPDGTTMAGVEGYLDGINLDNTFAGTPVNTPSGNNPFGYEDPQSLAIGPSGAVDFGTGGLEDEGQAVGEEFADTPVSTPSGNNPFGYEDLNPSVLANPGINNLGAFDDFADVGVDNTVDYGMPQGSPGQLNPAAPSINNITELNQIQDSPDMDDGIGLTEVELNQIQDQPLRDKLSSSLTSATEGLSNAAELTGEKLREIGTSIAAAVGGVFKPDGSTITVPGLGEIDVKQTIGGMILNQVVGGPITLALSAAKAIAGLLPKDSLENSTKRSIAAQLTANNTYGYNMGNDSIGQDPFGRNPVSGFGNYEQTLAEDAAYVGDSKFRNAKKDYAQDYFNAKAEKAGGVDMGDGTVLGPGEASDDVVSLEDLLKSQPVTVDKISGDYSPDDDDPANEEPIGDQGSTVNTETGNITDSTGNYAGNIMDEFAAPAPAPAPPAPAPSYNYGGGGGGNGGGGGGGGGSPGSSGPGGSDEMGSFKKGGLAGLKRYAK